jgi:transposase
MSKALSVDLRDRVLVAVAAGATHRTAAERFGVSAASVSRWRALAREQGDARPKALGGDRRSGRIEACKALVLSLLEETPDMTLEEMREALAERGACVRFRHSPAFLQTSPDHAQKKTAHASEQERPDIAKQRQAWFDGQLDLDPENLVSSMRPGPPPIWRDVTDGRRAASACGSAFRMGRSERLP